MLNGKEGRLLRRNNDKDTRMKINILLCDDDKGFFAENIRRGCWPAGTARSVHLHNKKLESCRDNRPAIIAVSHYVLGHRHG